MGKDKKETVEVQVEIDEKEEEINVKLSISEETLQNIPRVGQSMYVIRPYPTHDDEDLDERGKIKEDAILAYSYNKQMVSSTALSDDHEELIINGDFRFH